MYTLGYPGITNLVVLSYSSRYLGIPIVCFLIFDEDTVGYLCVLPGNEALPVQQASASNGMNALSS